MKQTRLIMGTHITIEVVDRNVDPKHVDEVFAYFRYVDEKFSTYKKTSEISRINQNPLRKWKYSPDMKRVLALCELTREQTNGYFDIHHNGKLDPSGLVKGWSIWQAARLLKGKGYRNFYVDVGGDIQVSGENAEGRAWTVGIRNPFNDQEVVKVLSLGNDEGVATSGTACRGQHIYDPHSPGKSLDEIVSLSVVASNIYDADRFATAAFAMGANGISFIEGLPGFEGYMIDRNGIATFTSGFPKYVASRSNIVPIQV